MTQLRDITQYFRYNDFITQPMTLITLPKVTDKVNVSSVGKEHEDSNEKIVLSCEQLSRRFSCPATNQTSRDDNDDCSHLGNQVYYINIPVSESQVTDKNSGIVHNSQQSHEINDRDIGPVSSADTFTSSGHKSDVDIRRIDPENTALISTERTIPSGIPVSADKDIDGEGLHSELCGVDKTYRESESSAEADENDVIWCESVSMCPTEDATGDSGLRDQQKIEHGKYLNS